MRGEEANLGCLSCLSACCVTCLGFVLSMYLLSHLGRRRLIQKEEIRPLFILEGFVHCCVVRAHCTLSPRCAPTNTLCARTRLGPLCGRRAATCARGTLPQSCL